MNLMSTHNKDLRYTTLTLFNAIYTSMEELKDGHVFNNKYKSSVKKYENLHAVVLMNQHPPGQQ